MVNSMPTLNETFATRVQDTLSLVGSTETLWLTAPPTSAIRQQLKTPQLEALYESAFLRIFGYWESFLEEVVVRWMAKYTCPGYLPVPAIGETLYTTVTSARTALHTEGGNVKDFLLWHSPDAVLKRVKKRLDGSPVEAIVNASSTELKNLAAVRHHIAHGSSDTLAKFKVASTALTGSDHSGKPGHALRSLDITDPLNTPKWLHVWSQRLVSLSNQVVA